MIKPKDGETAVTGFENITDAKNLALAGDSVPVGQYAREIFTNMGIMEEVEGMEINEGKMSQRFLRRSVRAATRQVWFMPQMQHPWQKA